MLEDVLGDTKWPVAAVLIAIAFAAAFGYSKTNTRQGDVQKQIIQICSSKPDVQQCADQLARSVQKVTK